MAIRQQEVDAADTHVAVDAEHLLGVSLDADYGQESAKKIVKSRIGDNELNRTTDAVVRTATAVIHAIRIVDLFRPVQADPKTDVELVKQVKPLGVEQRTIGLHVVR